ncbi:MAG: thioesterase family protein [Pseudomonadota bacterium]
MAADPTDRQETPRARGHDGPYAAPLRAPARAVPEEWIDYNGHMNVAYYAIAFDQAVDHFIEEELGLGESYAATHRQGPYVLQSTICYLGELLEGDAFTVEAQLVDCDAKRVHLMMEMRNAAGGRAATSEQLIMNVDLEARRGAPFPDWAQTRLARMLADHSALPRAAEMGQRIGIRRKG